MIILRRKRPPPEIDLRKEREETLRKIIARYEKISQNRMAELLKFPSTQELELWLMELPSNIDLYLKDGEVIIPKLLKSDSEEAEKAINQLLASFDDFEKKGKGKLE